MFSLHIQQEITEDKANQAKHQKLDVWDMIRRYGHRSTNIPEWIILFQGMPAIQVRLKFIEYFTQIYDRRELYKRLLQGSERKYRQNFLKILTKFLKNIDKFLTNIIWSIDFIFVIWS